MPTSANKTTLTEALADLPARVRVHELARRAGLNSKEAIDALAKAGVAVGSASSSVDREVAETVLTAMLGGGGRRGGGAASGRSKGSGKTASEKGAAGKSDSDKGASDKAASGRATKARAASEKTSAATEKGAADAATDGAATDGAATDGAASKGGRRGGAKKAAEAAPAEEQAAKSGRGRGRGAGAKKAAAEPAAEGADAASSKDESAEPQKAPQAEKQTRRTRSRKTADEPTTPAEAVEDAAAESDGDTASSGEESGSGRSRRRRRGGRGRRRSGSDAADHDESPAEDSTESHEPEAGDDDAEQDGDEDHEGGSSSSRRRRRRRRRGSSSDGDEDGSTGHESSDHGDVRGVKGSTRLEAKRQRRRDGRDSRRRPQILSEAEFLARRESVDRVMAVRQHGDLAQVALLEDGVLVEHFVSRQGSASMIGNIYLGTVQNVLPSMEAAFVDIGKGRNAVLYAGEVNWDIAGLEGKERRIETALSSGDTVLVQVSKDPIGHKGARLTTQISLPGRFLVFVPGGGANGISRKLPDTERKRLKKILDAIVPAEAGVIIRTAAEGVGEEDLEADVARLQAQWTEISEAAERAAKHGNHGPQQLYAEPDTLVKVIRDLFNSDINRLLVDGDDAWASVSDYVLRVAPELADRVSRYVGDKDVFAAFRIDEQISKALQRKVRLPSGGSLVIDRTEAMTVVDVNTGKFTGSGGNLEETVTRNNLEAAEEIVRQLRLRDIGGIIVVDFIDMVLESNRDLVLRRLTECLGRDRTRHQVAEVTSLGLVQMTRKRMGLGLVEAFSEPCATCQGRGIVLHDAPAEFSEAEPEQGRKRGRRRGKGPDDDAKFEPLVVDRVSTDAKPDPRGPKPPALFRSEGAERDAEPADADLTAAVAADETVSEPVAETPVSAPADQGPASTEEPAAETVVAEATVDEPARAAEPMAEQKPAAKKPARRRRAAGRPAGAPTAATAVEIVLGGE